MTTPTSRLQRTITHYRQLLIQREVQAVHALTEAYTRTLAGVQASLDALYRDMDAKQQAGEDIPISWLYEQHRLQTAQQFILNQFNHYGTITQMTVAQLQRWAVHLGMQAAQQQLQIVAPGEPLNMPSPSVLENLIGATQAGSPLADLFRGFGEEAAKGAGDALLRGVSLGSSIPTIARDVRQALDVSRSRSLTIARTETLRPYRSANLETYRASGLVQQWRWVAAKQARTCAACIAMDGTLHDLDEEMASHVNCRCTPIPVRDASTSEYQTGPEWFDGQREAVQKQILGAKYEGWANGDFTLADVVGMSHDPDWGSSVYEKSLKALVK